MKRNIDVSAETNVYLAVPKEQGPVFRRSISEGDTPRGTIDTNHQQKEQCERSADKKRPFEIPSFQFLLEGDENETEAAPSNPSKRSRSHDEDKTSEEEEYENRDQEIKSQKILPRSKSAPCKLAQVQCQDHFETDIETPRYLSNLSEALTGTPGPFPESSSKSSPVTNKSSRDYLKPPVEVSFHVEKNNNAGRFEGVKEDATSLRSRPPSLRISNTIETPSEVLSPTDDCHFENLSVFDALNHGHQDETKQDIIQKNLSVSGSLFPLPLGNMTAEEMQITVESPLHTPQMNSDSHTSWVEGELNPEHLSSNCNQNTAQSGACEPQDDFLVMTSGESSVQMSFDQILLMEKEMNAETLLLDDIQQISSGCLHQTSGASINPHVPPINAPTLASVDTELRMRDAEFESDRPLPLVQYPSGICNQTHKDSSVSSESVTIRHSNSDEDEIRRIEVPNPLALTVEFVDLDEYLGTSGVGGLYDKDLDEYLGLDSGEDVNKLIAALDNQNESLVPTSPIPSVVESASSDQGKSALV